MNVNCHDRKIRSWLVKRCTDLNWWEDSIALIRCCGKTGKICFGMSHFLFFSLLGKARSGLIHLLEGVTANLSLSIGLRVQIQSASVLPDIVCPLHNCMCSHLLKKQWDVQYRNLHFAHRYGFEHGARISCFDKQVHHSLVMIVGQRQKQTNALGLHLHTNYCLGPTWLL